MALIEYPDQWDAIQIVLKAKSQVWDETIAVECPDIDRRTQALPANVDRHVFASSGHRMLERIEYRLHEMFKGCYGYE